MEHAIPRRRISTKGHIQRRCWRQWLLTAHTNAPATVSMNPARIFGRAVVRETNVAAARKTVARPANPATGSPLRPRPQLERWHEVASRRSLHQKASSNAQAATAASTDLIDQVRPQAPSNPALSFPCLDAVERRSQTLSRKSLARGPEPEYSTGRHLNYHSKEPILLDWGGVLPEFDVAFETWGTLNMSKSNAILLHTGLSASSHAHSTDENPKPGWWEKFIGPGRPLDTDKYYIVCTNVVGGCYGSTGPASLDPANGERYATRFPILTMDDMVRAQFRLLDHLGIDKLYASVGSSMGGMLSLASGVLFPDRVGRIATVSGCARSHPYSIAMRHTQRQGMRYLLRTFRARLTQRQFS